ncbi:MAG: hypothetical protein IAE78_04700 [Myxococcus sp.]|nr:hypothetical protein [Myxococcus sp.]
MSVEASLARAKAAAARLPFVPGDVSELLRADAVTFCAKAPEPPVYRRRDDPSRAAARALIGEGEALLARAYQSNDSAWVTALEAWLLTLHHIADGKVELAEAAWVEAQRAELRATGRRRLYAVSDEARAPVFDPRTGQSRFDPRPERSMRMKVPCPACRKVSELSFSSSVALHQFGCTHCAATWWGYFGEVRSVEVSRRGNKRTYSFRLTELAGPQTRVEVEDASSGELQVAQNDLLAFLYHPRSVLRGVLNLSSSRVLWITGAGPCFVATVAFGPGAPELEVLRRFRDQGLLPSRLGRRLVAGYYTHGPALARVVNERPWLRRQTRRALSLVVRRLSERDHG